MTDSDRLVTEFVTMDGRRYAKIHKDWMDVVGYPFRGEVDGWGFVSEEVTDHRRWSVTNKIVLRYIPEGTFWMTWRDDPATEMQDGQERWDIDSNDMVELVQAWPHPVVTVEYKSTRPEGVTSDE